MQFLEKESLPENIRVVSYNLLSPLLADPSHNVQCHPHNLDADTRFIRICKVLKTQMENGAVRFWYFSVFLLSCSKQLECKIAKLKRDLFEIIWICHSPDIFYLSSQICCLQEVGLSWEGPLQVMFEEYDYSVLSTMYGRALADYMGKVEPHCLVCRSNNHLHQCHCMNAKILNLSCQVSWSLTPAKSTV